MASTSTPTATNKKVASRLREIPDHLLAEIFLRLPAPEDLARASAVCVSFRQLVTGRSFLRSFRRLHPPPLLGFRDHDGFNPALPPHPSAPAARALALAADFSYSFLPSHCRWAVQDIRDGRVLLHRVPERRQRFPLFTVELVVCDPLHRLHVLVPPVPDDLASSVQHPDPMVCRPQSRLFLLPLGEEEEETTFRVVCMLLCKTNLSVFVFSSSSRQWRAAASKDWSDLVCGKGESDTMLHMRPFFLRRNYAYGCFYWDWLLIKSKRLLVLDTRSMEFSMAHLPPGEWSPRGLAIVEAGEGRLGMFAFLFNYASDLSYYTIARNQGESPSQWRMEKTISLESGYQYYIKDATETYLLLRRTETTSLENPLTEYCSMDIKTLKLHRICPNQSTPTNMYGKHIYTNFPPSLLSSPTV